LNLKIKELSLLFSKLYVERYVVAYKIAIKAFSKANKVNHLWGAYPRHDK
jgi:hypothetical protein